MKKTTDIILGLAVLTSFLVTGEWFAAKFSLVLPGSMVGMVLLFAALSLKIVKIEWIEDLAGFLHSNLVLLFIPAAVGIKLYWALLLKSGIAIMASIFISTLAVLWITAKTIELFAGKSARKGEDYGN